MLKQLMVNMNVNLFVQYECKFICPKCNTPMYVYKGCISDAVEKNELSCQHCGSNNVIVKEGLE